MLTLQSCMLSSSVPESAKSAGHSAADPEDALTNNSKLVDLTVIQLFGTVITSLGSLMSPSV